MKVYYLLDTNFQFGAISVVATLSADKSLAVLVVDDEPDISRLFEIKLGEAGFRAMAAANIKKAFAAMAKQRFDAILLDLFLDNDNALNHLPSLLAASPDTKIVILTGNGSIDFAVNAMNKGASGFLVKTDHPDINIAKFKGIVATPEPPKSHKFSLANLGIIGQSPAVLSLGEKIIQLNNVDSTVLLQGESGTGKELCARAIHKVSNRSSGPFIAINCAAIAESILESELFGYKRGAFTDARQDRKGYFETCSEGTLFLDEIGEMSPSLQSKLLRVLQEKEVTPLGSCAPVPINTRIIAATNRNLHQDVADKKFRDDLYYRLAVFQIPLPALRERKEDIPLLVNHFIEHFNNRFNKSAILPSKGLYARLKAYDWPGNIRELCNAVERAVVLSKDNLISAEDLLPFRPQASDLETQAPRLTDLPLNFQSAKDSFEKFYIENLLRITDGNVAEAARVSGQYRPNVYRLINKFHIDPQKFKYRHNLHLG